MWRVFGYNGGMKSKIKAKWIIKLSQKATLKVKTKEKIETGQLLGYQETDEIKLFDVSLILNKLSKEKIEEINVLLSGKHFALGELMWETAGMVGKKIFSPIDGEFLEIDEFNNINFRVINDNKKEIISPVAGLIDKIEKDKLSIGFEAIEFKGKGLNESKAWGDFDFREINQISDLDYQQEGKVILCHKLDPCLVIKADVVGVVAIIYRLSENNGVRIESDLPILGVDEGEWDNILWRAKGKSGVRALVNAKLGRVLLVL